MNKKIENKFSNSIDLRDENGSIWGAVFVSTSKELGKRDIILMDEKSGTCCEIGDFGDFGREPRAESVEQENPNYPPKNNNFIQTRNWKILVFLTHQRKPIPRKLVKNPKS